MVTFLRNRNNDWNRHGRHHNAERQDYAGEAEKENLLKRNSSCHSARPISVSVASQLWFGWRQSTGTDWTVSMTSELLCLLWLQTLRLMSGAWPVLPLIPPNRSYTQGGKKCCLIFFKAQFLPVDKIIRRKVHFVYFLCSLFWVCGKKLLLRKWLFSHSASVIV